MAGREPLSRAAVLGRPVAHSLSPALHTAAYGSLGLSGWSYEAIEVGEDDLLAFLDGLDHTWVGLSLTMPLKQAVVPLLDQVSPLAGALGVVNTVTFGVPDGADSRADPGADPRWTDPRLRTRRGDNTDVAGIVEAVRPALGPGAFGGDGLVVLGAGATAASALAAGARLGFGAATLCARSAERAAATTALGERLGLRVDVRTLEGVSDLVAGAALVVSTLPAGAADDLALTSVRPGAVLLDVVYEPWPTRLAAAWAALGGAVVPGTEMLLHQAARQVELMTGRVPDVDAMRAVLPRGRVR